MFCRNNLILTNFYAIRTPIVWHIFGAYVLQIWGGGGGQNYFHVWWQAIASTLARLQVASPNGSHHSTCVLHWCISWTWSAGGGACSLCGESSSGPQTLEPSLSIYIYMCVRVCSGSRSLSPSLSLFSRPVSLFFLAVSLCAPLSLSVSFFFLLSLSLSLCLCLHLSLRLFFIPLLSSSLYISLCPLSSSSSSSSPSSLCLLRQ